MWQAHLLALGYFRTFITIISRNLFRTVCLCETLAGLAS
jgi:hypothetical protein